jgi:RND superfamily putative drug exporter
LSPAFLALGRWVARHPWGIVLGWILALVLGFVGSQRLAGVTVGVEGGVPASPSHRANELLRTAFDNPYIDPVVVAVRAPKLRADEEPYLSWITRAARSLSALPGIRKVASYSDERDAQLRSADGHVTMMLAGLTATKGDDRQQGVRAVREALRPLAAELAQYDPRARVAVTGGTAADLDINSWSAEGGDRAEKRALPGTLAILVVAFGTLIAAGLPFLTGLATTTVSLGLAYSLAQVMPVSNLLGNVVTMIGLAIGIDYSLLMVTHFREHSRTGTPAEHVALTVAQGGRTISWSGLTVIVGLLGLLFSPLVETRSVGIGGALVVCVSVLAALTLLPAALLLLGHRLDWLPVLPRRRSAPRLRAFWRGLGGWIVRHPFVTLLFAGACALAIAAPALRLSAGFTNERWFLPKHMEAREGAELLSEVRSENAALVIYLVVRTTDQQPLLAAAHLQALCEFSRQLASDARIAKLRAPLALREGMQFEAYQNLYEDPDNALRVHPQIAELYVSHDRRAGLFEVVPAQNLSARDIHRLSRELTRAAPAGPFEVFVGGTPAEHNDFNDYMARSLPRIIGFVVCATLLLLFAAFRSYLLPIKAVLMNLLAVAAGIGAVVAIFQFGWLHALVGLEHPFMSIPPEIPLMVFCLSFGLSMDYELFLLFRIQQEYARDGDNDRATVEGLVMVAPVITGAGLIMVVVFGAFASAPLPVLKMMGIGLCVAVLVDATLIRALIVPAVMAIAGRWNWYPGSRPHGRRNKH